MVVPSSTVKSGWMERAELFVTARLSCATVASWPVVLTESMDMASGLAVVSAARTAAPHASPPVIATAFHRRQQADSGSWLVVAAATTPGGISMTR